MKISISAKLTKLVVVTGPLNSGKSTLKQNLARKFKVRPVPEYQYGIDLANKNCWTDVLEFSKDSKSYLVESHLSYNGFDAGDFGAKIGTLVAPSGIDLTMYFVVPTLDDLLQRQIRFDSYASKESAQADLKWYDEMFSKLVKLDVNCIKVPQ